MTYCLGIKVRQGLVAIADTRITSGTEKSTKKKIYIENSSERSLFIMTSGLRSIRDKALYYFQEVMEQELPDQDKMYKAVNLFGDQVKRVAKEDGPALKKAGLSFNLTTIIGGQLKNDKEHKLFLIYAEGNWVEINDDSPYVIIGNSGHGKTILNRVLTSSSTIEQALKAGFLSFDSTRVSANNVDFPIDVTTYRCNSYQLDEKRFSRGELEHVSSKWDSGLKDLLDNLPTDWVEGVITKTK